MEILVRVKKGGIDLPEPCIQEAVIAELIVEQRNMKESDKSLIGAINNINTELKEINRKWGERPSWATTLLITFLASTCVGLLVKLF